jgi:hypothetical protein
MLGWDKVFNYGDINVLNAKAIHRQSNPPKIPEMFPWTDITHSLTNHAEFPLLLTSNVASEHRLRHIELSTALHNGDGAGTIQSLRSLTAAPF